MLFYYVNKSNIDVSWLQKKNLKSQQILNFKTCWMLIQNTYVVFFLIFQQWTFCVVTWNEYFIRWRLKTKMKSVILYPYGPLRGNGCCRMLHVKHLAVTSGIYTLVSTPQKPFTKFWFCLTLYRPHKYYTFITIHKAI